MLACQRPPRRKREPIQVFPDGREVCDLDTAKGRAEYANRLYEMEVRQYMRCAICEQMLYPRVLEFDHQDGRGHGGGHRDDRIIVNGQWHNAALCESCNTEKGSKRYHWIEGKYTPVVKGGEVYAKSA